MKSAPTQPTEIAVEAIEAAEKIVNARIAIGDVITGDQCRDLIFGELSR